MAALELSPADRKAHSLSAHRLNPVVLLGSAGLTPAVLQEIDRALSAHGLIKVRLAGAERDERSALAATITDALSCGQVQLIGAMLVLYRPKPEVEQATPARRPAAKPTKARQQTPAERSRYAPQERPKRPTLHSAAGRKAKKPATPR